MLKRKTGSSQNDYTYIAPEVPGDVEQTWPDVSKPKRLLVCSPTMIESRD